MGFINMNNNSKIVYSKVLDEWLEYKKGNIKESSYLKYLSVIETLLKPNLGYYKFSKITKEVIDDFFNNSHIKEKSDSTKRIALIIIISSLKYGVEMKYRKSIEKINIKFKKSRNKITYFTKKEQDILFNYLKNNLNVNNIGILVSLYTGIRLGELCGLKKCDFDFVNNTISINRTVQRIKELDKLSKNKTKLSVSIPKTDSSIRIIPLPMFLVSILIDLLNTIENEEFYIFTSSLKPKDPRTFEKHFDSILKKCNLRKLNFHSLRHTFATRSCEAGINIKVLSEILGHSSYHVTQEIYIHISSEFKRNSIESLMNYLKQENS